ncbi:MAG: MtrB/PioB family outer membrane beta-barrel protein [Acidobacteriota bacterium]
MKRIIAIAAALLAAPAFAQTPPPAPTVRVTGSITTGVEQVDNSSGSSKLTEYRDLRDEFFVPTFVFRAADSGSRTYFDVSGSNVSRADQSIAAELSRPGAFSIQALWNETPHNYSFKAVSPYIERAPGVFAVPATVPITFKRLATGAADAPGVVASDQLVADFQAAYLKPAPLGVDSRAGRFAVDWRGDALALAVAYDRLEKNGYKWGFGPIGDRPPRTLNIQLTEPVDYRTGNLTLAAEHQGRGFQLRGEYAFSDFANGVDTLRWQNVYTTAAPGADFDVWDRLVATSGARPLPPDNSAHTVTGSAGVDTPADGRFSAMVSYGRLLQDATLLPYSTFPGALAVSALPRASAAAEMTTRHLSADYVVNPGRLNLRAYYRWYDLDNDTPADRWQYVTSDTSNLDGSVTFLNKRVSIGHAWDRNQAGLDATVRLPRRSSLGLSYEREAIGRAFREADTTEHVLRVTLRSRPAGWLSTRARVVVGARDGGEYNNEVTHASYWYTQAEATGFNNPALTFDNHPDMRRYDVSDRARRQVDFTVNLTPRDAVALSAFVRYRKDDFDSDVGPSQPLADTALAEAAATTPGDQLGRLEDSRLRYGLELYVEPNPRATFTVFVNYDLGASFIRSLEFNENNKANPSTIATAALGPWTRRGSQWSADTDDRTWSGGLGTTLQVVPDRATLMADYTMSLAAIDILYAGFGVTNWDGTPFPPNHEFAFPSNPPDIAEDLHVVNLRLEVPVRQLAVILGYTFEKYTLVDWQQQGTGLSWVEPVGADTLLRDTSRSHQWGNRLFNLGTYLAPGYTAHIGFVGVRYRF